MVGFDSYLGLYAKSLHLREQKASQIAHNIANADTPNFTAKDIDFNQALTRAMNPTTQMVTDSPRHINGSAEFSTQLKYRVPTRQSLDGNTVDKDVESTEFATNSLNYQATLSFINGKIRSMLTAIKGE